MDFTVVFLLGTLLQPEEFHYYMTQIYVITGRRIYTRYIITAHTRMKVCLFCFVWCCRRFLLFSVTLAKRRTQRNCVQSCMTRICGVHAQYLYYRYSFLSTRTVFDIFLRYDTNRRAKSANWKIDVVIIKFLPFYT